MAELLDAEPNDEIAEDGSDEDPEKNNSEASPIPESLCDACGPGSSCDEARDQNVFGDVS